MPPIDLPFSQTPREEKANAVSHALGCMLALVALPALAQQVGAVQHPVRQVGMAVFLASMVLMYAVSAAYHAVPAGPAKRLLRRCDHAVIFVFIAGSYTPFALSALQHGGGGTLLVAVWAVALAGGVLKLSNRLRQPWLSTGLYLAFGWLVAWVARPVLAALPPPGLQLLVAGGLAYTLGSLFYLLDRRMPYSHLVWHLFVITGSTCHFLALRHTLG